MTIAEVLNPDRVSIMGRVTSTRKMGKGAFVNVRDATGTTQLYVHKNEVGALMFDGTTTLEPGTYVKVDGARFITKTGEIAIRPHRIIVDVDSGEDAQPMFKEYVKVEGAL